jgi:catechol 2,3-dioxygenase-like lactoylglutathione lyase family enzyme
MSNINYDGSLTCAFGVKDLNQSLDWYKNNLGFEEQYKLEDMGWAEVKTPCSGVTMGLSQIEDLKVEGGHTPVFGVKDIEATRAELEGNGVNFDGPIQTIEGVVKLTTFFDPDGNKMMFSQSLAQG